MRASIRCRVLELAALATCTSLHAAQLPLRNYTTADGLVNNTVISIAPDSRGFLWFGTTEGLSRFDGFGFTNQTASTGLLHTTIRQLLIGRRGDFWLATPEGLVRFRPDLPQSSADRRVVIRPDGKPESARIAVVLEDRAGTIWCGTGAGLFTVDDATRRRPRLVEVQIGLPGVAWGDSGVSALTEDAEGGVWIGARDGTLYRRLPDGHIERHTAPDAPAQAEITRLLADRNGRIWLGRGNGIYRSISGPHPGANGFEHLLGQHSGQQQNRVFDIFESKEGDIWVGMFQCLAQFPVGGAPVRVWNKDNGLPNLGVAALAQDRDGNLWLGTGDQGAFKLAAGGVLTYSMADGIGVDAVISVAETLRGQLYISGRMASEGFRIGIRSGDGFQSFAPRVPQRVSYLGWRPARVILQDQGGEWWLASSQGLCRYAKLETPSQLSLIAPKTVYTTRDGLPSDVVVRLYEDRRGNIWVGTETPKISYWSRTGQKFITVPADGVIGFASAFGEDSAGHVWIGDEQGQLWVVRDGHASKVPGLSGRAGINDLLLDHLGRIWVATDGQGLLRFDQPSAANPQFSQYGDAAGLSSLNLHTLAEDSNGCIYIGTGGGIDRLDPDLAHIRHYHSADGVAQGEVNVAYRDRTGAIWFGTNHGLTRIVPRIGPTNDPPPVWMTGLSIAGRDLPVSEAGESSIRQVEVLPGQEQIQFDFVGLSYSPGNVLRYQYRLGNDRWSAPIESRSVHYGALAPGRYRFAVRAVNSDGEASQTPATVEFRVVPSLWRRPWFQAILFVAGICGAVLVHRVRAGRLLEIERVRSNIALDLHDDIASNLAQITIFSEIAMRTEGLDSRASEPLARIAETARETVECISDIVWSIRPQKEGDLLQRIRRFGSDALTSRQIDVSFHFSEEVRRLTLDPNTRRQVYLVYKEAVHNTVRHSRAAAVDISMTVNGAFLILRVADNGKGLESPEEGNGLPGMRARAESLGGTLSIHSGPGKGTEVELQAPWRRPRRPWTLPR